MKKILALVPLFCVLAGFSGGVSAQELGQRLVLKGGLSIPTTAGPRGVGGTWWVGGAEFQLNEPLARNVNSLELLYTARSGDRTQDFAPPVRERFSVWSVSWNHKVRMVGGTDPGRQINFYGGGIGFAAVDVQAIHPTTGVFTSANDVVPSINLFVGTEVARNLQVEAKYRANLTAVGGHRTDSILLLLGVRL